MLHLANMFILIFHLYHFSVQVLPFNESLVFQNMEEEFNEIYDDEDDSNGMKAQLCLSSFYCRHEFIQTK